MSSSPIDPTAPARDRRLLVDVVMPQMGVSVAEGTLVAWHKRPGDWVLADETICEISTDKIDTEVPSPAGGRVVELLVAEEETVPVGSVLARVAIDAVAGQPHPDEQGPVAGRLGPPPPPPGGRPSPVVRRIAEREGVDLSRVTGTGRGGRVRKQDILAYLQERDGAGAAGAPRSAPAGPASDGSAVAPLHIESPYREEPAGDAVAAGAGGGATSEPLSRMRRTIAEHMVRSLHTAAHCTSIMEVDMSAVEAARASLGLTGLAFVARATINALQAHPQLNATLQDGVLTRHADVNLGIAVSLGEEGLIVPVIVRAQELSVQGIAARIRELAARARANELTPDEVSRWHVHHHQPGQLRHARLDADHQPAAGGDPRPRGGGQAGGGGDR